MVDESKDICEFDSEELDQSLPTYDLEKVVDIFNSSTSSIFNIFYFEAEKGQTDQYIAAMARRAKTHRAKDYRFNTTSFTDVQDINSSRKSYSASTCKQLKKADIYK